MLYIDYPVRLSAEIIPGLPIRWYGLMYLVAFAITYLLFMWQIRKREDRIDKDDVMNLFFWGIIGLLIGARLFATLVFDDTGFYRRQPWLIFWPFRDGQFVGLQGMNYYGGVVGAVIAIVIYARIRKIDVLDWGDMITAGIPLGYTFGRLGNFINGELFGRVTTAPFGMVFPHARQFPAAETWVRETAAQIGMSIAPDQVMVNLPRHPTQLYEAFAEGIVAWFILWFIVKNRKPFKGFVIAMYVLTYGLFRFIIDYFRMPLGSGYLLALEKGNPVTHLLTSPFNFIDSQVFSFAMVVAGVGLIFLFRAIDQRKRTVGESKKDEASTTQRRKQRKKLQKGS